MSTNSVVENNTNVFSYSFGSQRAQLKMLSGVRSFLEAVRSLFPGLFQILETAQLLGSWPPGVRFKANNVTSLFWCWPFLSFSDHTQCGKGLRAEGRRWSNWALLGNPASVPPLNPNDTSAESILPWKETYLWVLRIRMRTSLGAIILPTGNPDSAI